MRRSGVARREPLAVRPAAQDDVARKQALVLAPPPLGLKRIWSPRPARGRRRGPRRWHRRGGSSACSRARCVQQRAGDPGSRGAAPRLGASAGAAGVARSGALGSGCPVKTMIPRMPSASADHDPRLRPARQHATRCGAMVGDRRCSGVASAMAHRPLLEREAVLAERQVAAVEHLRDDVRARAGPGSSRRRAGRPSARRARAARWRRI